jgi:hypothetical protein
MGANLPPVTRADIKAVIISARLELPGLPFVIDALPAGSRVIVESGSLRYTTAHLADALFRDSFIRNDLTGHDDVRISTPLNRQELRNPREEDKELARNLLDHLNEHIERYHHALWGRMSADRRYMLLDGFQAPGSGGRSVASVVDNELIGIVGNCLVLPVARGFHLDPTFNQDVENPADLLEHYEPNTPIEPSRVAIPTRGVYCEAVMGACNSCEVKDETRFWRWEESPIPDQPPAILPTSTDTRRAEPPDLTAKDLPPAIVAMQSAPAAPDPTGVGAVLQLLGQSGIFRDMAGLEGTQRNAAAALEGAFQTATAFGTKAADLALQGKMAKDIDKAMKTIQAARGQGLITDQQASELTDAAIRGMLGAGATNPPNATTTDEVKQLTETAGENSAALSVTRPTGEKVEVDARNAPVTLASFTGSGPSKAGKKLPTRSGTQAPQAWETLAPIAARNPATCPSGIKNLGTILFVHDAETKIDLRDYGGYTNANVWMLVHTVSDLIEGLRSHVGNCGYVSGIHIEAHGGFSGSGGFRMGDDTDGDGRVESSEANDMVSTAAQAATFGAIVKNALAPGGFVAVAACESSGTNDAFLKALNTATGAITIGSPKDCRSGGNWFHGAWWECDAGRTQINVDGTRKVDTRDDGTGIWRPF